MVPDFNDATGLVSELQQYAHPADRHAVCTQSRNVIDNLGTRALEIAQPEMPLRHLLARNVRPFLPLSVFLFAEDSLIFEPSDQCRLEPLSGANSAFRDL